MSHIGYVSSDSSLISRTFGDNYLPFVLVALPGFNETFRDLCVFIDGASFHCTPKSFLPEVSTKITFEPIEEERGKSIWLRFQENYSAKLADLEITYRKIETTTAVVTTTTARI